MTLHITYYIVHSGVGYCCCCNGCGDFGGCIGCGGCIAIAAKKS